MRAFRTLAGALAISLALGHSALAAPPARAMYAAALAEERALRATLAEADDSSRAARLKEIRALIAAYEAIPARYPKSGYSDNALWQGAGLALEAFNRFGESRDQRTAVRLLTRLAREYPTSSLASKAEGEARTLHSSMAAVAPARSPARPTPPAAAADAPGVRTPSKLPAASPLPPPAPAPDAPPAPSVVSGPSQIPEAIAIRDIRRSALPSGARITIELDAEVQYHQERLSRPDRLFFDLQRTAAPPSMVDRTLAFNEDLVRYVRIGKRPNGATRVVLDAEGVTRFSVFALYNPYRLIIDCERDPTAAPPVPPSPPAARTPEPMPEPPIGPPSAIPGAPASAEPPPLDLASRPPLDAASPSPVTLPPVPAVPSTNLRGRFSIARQLGLGISRIVIDAGHGGRDPGAQGQRLSEADLVLDVALRLERLLAKEPGVDVVLTRRSDAFIPLEERTAIANRETADLFLSIHANASRNEKARGIETYFLNFATNADAEAVAARENSASGRTMHNLPDIVRAIALTSKRDESRDLATLVQQAMFQRLRRGNRGLRDLGVKQAPFVVLIGAAMPSVLVEISFVTNRQEAQLLRSGAYRQRIAEALLEGVRRYQRSLKTVRTVAHQ